VVLPRSRHGGAVHGAAFDRCTAGLANLSRWPSPASRFDVSADGSNLPELGVAVRRPLGASVEFEQIEHQLHRIPDALLHRPQAVRRSRRSARRRPSTIGVRAAERSATVSLRQVTRHSPIGIDLRTIERVLEDQTPARHGGAFFTTTPREPGTEYASGFTGALEAHRVFGPANPSAAAELF
jgi:hypothetical protein